MVTSLYGKLFSRSPFGEVLSWHPARNLWPARRSCCWPVPRVFVLTNCNSPAIPAGRPSKIDGVTIGTTPCEKDFPGGYFHKTKTSYGARLEHPLVARISLAGYATKELTLTEGPQNWVSLNGRSRGEYWLFKTDRVHVELCPISETFAGEIVARVSDTSAGLQAGAFSSRNVRQTNPAVVYLKGLDKSGTGFLVTGTGVIVTNAHVARGEESLLTQLSGGQQLEVKVVYIDADLDIALVKVEGPSRSSELPHLALADATKVRQGESVLAIGNPGDAMLFSVTKDIVSSVGKFPNAGPGRGFKPMRRSIRATAGARC